MSLSQGYAAYYGGHTKVDRLLFIAGASTDASVQLEALRLAHEEVKRVRPPAEWGSRAA